MRSTSKILNSPTPIRPYFSNYPHPRPVTKTYRHVRSWSCTTKQCDKIWQKPQKIHPNFTKIQENHQTKHLIQKNEPFFLHSHRIYKLHFDKKTQPHAARKRRLPYSHRPHQNGRKNLPCPFLPSWLQNIP